MWSEIWALLLYDLVFSQNENQSITFHYSSIWVGCLKKKSLVFERCSRLWGSKGERGVQQCTSSLCVEGHFLHSQETLILETDFLWQLIWAKALLKPFSTDSRVHTETKQGTEGGGSFETHLPHLTGCGVLPLLHFLFYNHIFSLSKYISLALLTKLLPFLLKQSSCFLAECCLVF